MLRNGCLFSETAHTVRTSEIEFNFEAITKEPKPDAPLFEVQLTYELSCPSVVRLVSWSFITIYYVRVFN